MIIIAHRALTQGADHRLENHPDQIQSCLKAGLHVEIDVRFENNTWWLGHDEATHDVPLEFLLQPHLWIHVKNASAAACLVKIQRSYHNLNFFWHQEDDRTLTSQHYWWTYPGHDLCAHSIAVMPELHVPIPHLKTYVTNAGCAGVCTDHVNEILK